MNLENTFNYWQSLDDDAWVAEVRRRLDTLSDFERRAVIAHELTETEWREQLAESRGPLARIPTGLKDLFDLQGTPTTASSTFLTEVRGDVATEDSEIVMALRQAGAVFVAKTHLVEFAYGLDGRNPHYGDCPNPVVPGRVSGGSSSGSAFLVGRGILPFTIGTDTGGSVRVPASFCGVYGYRAHAHWKMEGCFPLAPSFDTAGWFVSNEDDLRLTLDAMEAPGREILKSDRGVGLDFFDDTYSGPVNGCLSQFHCAPGDISGLRERTDKWAAAYSVLQSTEAYQVHAEWLDFHKERYDPVVWQRIDRARTWTQKDWDMATEGVMDYRAWRDTMKQEFDYVGLRAAPTPPPDPEAALTEPIRHGTLAAGAIGSMAALPVIIFPIPGMDEPLGAQFVVL